MGRISIGGIAIGGGNSTAEINVTMYIVDSTTGQVLGPTSVVGKVQQLIERSYRLCGTWLGRRLQQSPDSNMGKGS